MFTDGEQDEAAAAGEGQSNAVAAGVRAQVDLQVPVPAGSGITNNTCSNDMIPIEQAVLALHPPRVGRLSAAANGVGGGVVGGCEHEATADPTATGGSGSSGDRSRSTRTRSSSLLRSQPSFSSSSSITTGAACNLDVSSHHVSAASCPSGPIAGGAGRRFGQLLLEHGELHLQDWAVLAASASVPSFGGAASSSSASSSGADVNTSTHNGKRGGGKDKQSRSGRSRRRRSSKSSSKRNVVGSSSGSNGGRIPSIGMRAIPGRLRLCTRSIVFEPDDATRGIIRCPFSRMAGRPRAASPTPASASASGIGKGIGGATAAASSVSDFGSLSANGGNANGSSKQQQQQQQQQGEQPKATAVAFKCSRHAVMKTGNVIAPHTTVDAAAEFCFTFRYSSPAQFFDLIGRLLGPAATADDGAASGRSLVSPPTAAAIDKLLKPMLDRPFDPHNLRDMRETPRTSNLRCHHLSPLQDQPGCSIVTDRSIYFQPASGVLSTVAEPATSFALADIVATARRYHGLRDCALELYLASGVSVLLAFETKTERERVLSLLPRNVPCHTDASFVRDAYDGWRLGKISNFDYLLALNSAAGRTFHDLSRYPVFPWVVADYTSEELDLNNPDTFRDLTKPVGALNEERLQYFMTRYKSMEGDMDHAFLYGTHYSAPGYVLYYLVRSMPEQMLCLQNGKFDSPDRMFHDLDHTYSSVLINHADVKELIAEFYDPQAGYDFLINARGLRLGSTQTGERVHDVKMPKWAKSPRDFLEKNRRALECDAVTAMLPRWIDLIFGDKSRGQGAKDALNLFHPTAYTSSADFDALKTEEERTQAELQATEFGICPDVLFSKPHPLKSAPAAPGNFIALDLVGRAMNLDQLGDDIGDYSKADGGDQPWELLETPALNASLRGSTAFESEPKVAAENGAVASRSATMATASNPFDDEEPEPAIGQVESFEFPEANGHGHTSTAANKNLSLKGSGIDRGKSSRSRHGKSNVHPTESFETADGPPSRPVRANTVEELPLTHNGWERKSLVCQKVHSDVVSGCNLLVQEGPHQSSYLASVSLDGRLLVHTLPFLQDGEDQKRRTFSVPKASTITRLSYLGLGADKNEPLYTLNELRSHSSSDPLACLALTADDAGGRIAFAGGHDDVVFAYGINSACALASVYSHRDAVTGVDLLKRSFANDSIFDSETSTLTKSTHIMVTGSYDATIKVWSVSVASGETVSIDRKPLAEFFDADASIVSVSASEIYGTGLVIAAGCSDGSLMVWLCHKNGSKKVLYKEEAKRGKGSCAAVKWAPGSYLFASFGDGRVASYVLKNDAVRPVSRISVGSPVQCLALVEENLIVGCADGGLRMIPIGEGAHFGMSPQPWKAVNGNAAPSLTSISASRIRENSHDGRIYMCATGAEDGSISIFQLSEAQ